MAIYKAFQAWHHYLEGTDLLIDVRMDHKNLEYFCTTWIFPGDKLSGQHFYLDLIWLLDFALATSELNPMHLLDNLTSTQKGRESLMVQSIHKIIVLFFFFTQLSTSLQATAMFLVVLCGVVFMDMRSFKRTF
jgi:RNase H-like domain found in reverse transcriptase